MALKIINKVSIKLKPRNINYRLISIFQMKHLENRYKITLSENDKIIKNEQKTAEVPNNCFQTLLS